MNRSTIDRLAPAGIEPWTAAQHALWKLHLAAAEAAVQGWLPHTVIAVASESCQMIASRQEDRR
jgi:hypothetical protein